MRKVWINPMSGRPLPISPPANDRSDKDDVKMIDLNTVKRLMKCFRGSVINERGELIIHRFSNSYFDLSTCEDELDVKCKVLEWLSRPACKEQPFKSERSNRKFQKFMLDGINEFLGTDFSREDIEQVYIHLGNRCDHMKTIRFIESEFDMDILQSRMER